MERSVLWLLSPCSQVTALQGETKRELCVLRVRPRFPCQRSRSSLLHWELHLRPMGPVLHGMVQALTVRLCSPEHLAPFHSDQWRVLDVQPSQHSQSHPHRPRVQQDSLLMLFIPVYNRHPHITPMSAVHFFPTPGTLPSGSASHIHQQQSPPRHQPPPNVPFPSCSPRWRLVSVLLLRSLNPEVRELLAVVIADTRATRLHFFTLFCFTALLRLCS